MIGSSRVTEVRPSPSFTRRLAKPSRVFRGFMSLFFRVIWLVRDLLNHVHMSRQSYISCVYYGVSSYAHVNRIIAG